MALSKKAIKRAVRDSPSNLRAVLYLNSKRRKNKFATRHFNLSSSATVDFNLKEKI